MRTPFKHQKEAIARGVNEPFLMVNGDCGTGKTFIGGQIAIRKGKTTLVIAPKNIIGVWKEAIMKDEVQESDIFVYDGTKKKDSGYFEKFIEWLIKKEGQDEE